MPYRKQNDADIEEVEALDSARERSDIERSALWPHAADGSSGLRERGASWPEERLDVDARGSARAHVGERTHGPYQLLTPIGTTAYGRAFRARHVAQDREVTLHFLAGAVDARRSAREQSGLARAAQGRDLPLAVAKCAQLSHANVIAIEEYGQDEDGAYYLVTEPLEGVSLADCLDDVCTLPLSRALSIAVQVGRALRVAHKLGIVHGALTPANVRLVMTDQGELARVVGFGSALLRDQDSESARSPEPDVRSDVFAVGELLFRMLAGRPPPVADGTVPLLSAWSAKPVPRALDELVARCLEPRAEHRLADLVTLTRGLREIARRVDASLRSEVDARGPGREAHVDARGPGRQPYVDARGSSHGARAEGRASSRAPRGDARGPGREAHVDARGPLRELRGRAPFASENAPAREYGPASDSDPAGSANAEPAIRYSGIAWIVLGLLLALAAVWLVWHASGRGPMSLDQVHRQPATQ